MAVNISIGSGFCLALGYCGSSFITDLLHFDPEKSQYTDEV